jgi:hypothetical protein
MKVNPRHFALAFTAVTGALLIAWVLLMLLIEVVKVTSLPPD